MHKLFLIAFSPLIIPSIFLMTYYGITSNDIGEKVFAVAAITLFIIWLIEPTIFGDTFFEDDEAQLKKKLDVKRAVILLIFVSLGTSFVVFSHTASNFVEKLEKKEQPVSIYVVKTYEENSVDFTYKWKLLALSRTALPMKICL